MTSSPLLNTIKLSLIRNHIHHHNTSTHQISGGSNNIKSPTAKERHSTGLSRRHMMLVGVGLVGSSSLSNMANGTSLTTTLDKTITTTIRRPKISRSQKEKQDEEEVLVIDGIELDKEMFVKFDVYINEDDPSRPNNTYQLAAGSFVNVPRKSMSSKKIKKMKTCLRLGVTDLLEDLDVDDDEYVVVSLVPRHGADAVVIGSVKIEFDH